MSTEHGAYAPGFAVRAQIARAIALSQPHAVEFENRKPSLSRDSFLKRYTETVDGGSESFIDLQIISLIHREEELDRAVQTHDALISFSNSEYLGALALGFLSGARIPEAVNIESNLDRSIFLQSAALRANDDRDFASGVATFVSTCFKSFGLHYPLRSFAELAKLAHAFEISWSPNSLHRVPELANEITASSWYVWGPEFRLALLDLAEGSPPGRAHLTEIYGLTYLSARVQALRDAAEAALDMDFEPEGDGDIGEAAIERYAVQSRARTGRSTRSALDNDYFELAESLINSLRRGLRTNKLEQAYRAIALLHELDPSILDFLDWEKLNHLMPTFREAPSIPKCFCDIMFATRSNNSLALRVARGDGVFIGSYSRVIEASRRQNKSLYALVGQIKAELPPRAAETFANYILRGDIVADLHLKLPPPTRTDEALDDEQGKTDYLRAAQRIALGQQFIGQRILAPLSCNEIFEEERRCIALLKFRKALARGRIRIRREFLRQEAARFVAQVYPGLQFNRRYSDFSNEEQVSAFVDLLKIDIEGLIKGVFLTGTNALDKQISSNIRHGWITDRYQASFINAIRECCECEPRGAFNWEDALVAENLGAAYEEATNLKREIALKVEIFLDQHLTVRSDWQELDHLRMQMRQRMSQTFTARTIILSDVIEDLAAHVRSTVIAVLNRMRQDLETVLVADINSLIERSRSEVIRAHGNRHAAFFDALTLSADATQNELSGWLKVTEEDVEFGSYRATHLVMFEAHIVHLSTSKQLNVEVKCAQEREGKSIRRFDFELRGGSFVAMTEVVHNPMSNAMKHSGEGRMTEIALSFIGRGDEFIVQCYNSYTSQAFKVMRADRERIAQLAKGESSEFAGREGSSGFQKIVDVCRHRLGVVPKINFIMPKAGRHHTSVEVRIPAGDLVVKVL
ncbi:hypothetical protein [Brevundimonas sp.]|uniref:hypothetical protein n=1 Tax=Brevundimonas sp. TaxID=1871086 RepID=UPI003F712736